MLAALLIGLASPAAIALPQQTQPVAPARDTLVTGVPALASAGVPGPLAVFGDRAFVIAAGKEDKAVLPVAAGAEWEKGRVVVLGHGGMIEAKSLDHAGTRAFVLNAANWLGRSPAAKIGVWRNDAMVTLLNANGFTAVALKPKWHETLAEYGAVVVDSHSIGPAERRELATYLKGGGGLLTAGLGWGWLQLNPGKTILDHPGNQLLIDAGIAWCDGTLDPTGPGEFTIGPVPESLHASNAMLALEAAVRDRSELAAQQSKTLIAALRALPPSHVLHARATKLLAASSAELTPSQGKPLRAKDGVARVLLSLQVDLERRTSARDVKAHPAAASFPGSVAVDAPRISRELTLDLTVPGWHSTGLYAAAGEVITITAADTHGASVRIGCHTDHLWHHDKWSRVPDISRQWQLKAGETQVASAFGGLVYIEIPRKREGTGTFAVAGAVESPRYVLGKTTAEEWKTLRNAPGPWGEVESRKVIVSVPSAALRTLENPEELMAFWDQISDAHATLGTIPIVPERPHRFVPDVQISAGYMHSGYPIMTHLDAVDDMVGVTRLREGTWGLLHELGHNHQEGDWTFGGTVEVTCNLFSLHAIDTICTPKPGDRGHGGVNTPPSLEKYLEGGAKFEQWQNDPFLALHMYVQLQKAFGWETFKKVFAEYRDLPRDQRPRGDDEKRDQWMVRFSRACGKNLGPFFVAWGVPTSAAARESIKDLPEWMPEGWPK